MEIAAMAEEYWPLLQFWHVAIEVDPKLVE
jgi:hypothetical protein